MSEDNTNVSGSGYLKSLRQRLERDLTDVTENGASEGDFLDFVIKEINASYRRGLRDGAKPRKKAHSNDEQAPQS